MKLNTALLASICVLNRQRSSSSHSRVAKKLSHMALSYASPTEPIEGRTPASRQRRPNSNEVYCLSSTGRRNTHVGRPQVLVKRLGRRLPAKSLARPGVEGHRHPLESI